VPGSIRFKELGNVWDKGIIRVGVSKKGANTEQHLGYGEGRAPLILENVKANSTIRVDVTVIDTCGEMHLGWFKWIIRREVNI